MGKIEVKIQREDGLKALEIVYKLMEA